MENPATAIETGRRPGRRFLSEHPVAPGGEAAYATRPTVRANGDGDEYAGRLVLIRKQAPARVDDREHGMAVV